MKEYEKPTIIISMFDKENVVTASGNIASDAAEEALQKAGVTKTKTVTWSEIIGVN